MLDFTQYDTDEKLVKVLIQHYGYLQDKRNIFNDLRTVLTKLFMPRRYDLLRNQQAGQRFGQTNYDPHPANAANKHVLGVIGHTISKSMPWLQLMASNQTLMNDDNVKKYLQESTEQLLYSFSRSTFYGGNFWCKKDEVVLGTGCLWPEEDTVKGRVVYLPIHPGEVYLEDDQYGNPAVLCRPFKYTAIKLLEKFGKDKLPPKVLKDAKGEDNSSNPFAEYNCLLCVYKNIKPKTDSLLPEDRAYKVFYLLLDDGDGSKKLLGKSGIANFPLIRRYGKENEVAYGTSLCADALTGALIVNKLGEKKLQYVHKLVEGVWRAHSNLRGKLNLNAGGRTYADKADEFVEQLYQGNSWPLADAESQRLDNEIDDVLMIRFFELLSGRELPQITAYQASRMEGEKVTLMNAIINSEEEFLEQAVAVQWDFEDRVGRMPKVPDVLFDPKNKGVLNVKYTGPLFQAQRQLLKTRGTVDWLQLVASITSIWPNAKIKVNELELIEDAGIAMGMEQKMFKSDEQINDIMAQMAQAEQEKEQSQITLEAAKVIPGLGKAVEAGSPAEMLANAV